MGEADRVKQCYLLLVHTARLRASDDLPQFCDWMVRRKLLNLALGAGLERIFHKDV